MPNTLTYSYTETRTRAEAVLDQFRMFLLYSKLAERYHDGILKSVNNRWIDAMGVFLASEEKRILEVEIRVDWKLHSDLCLISPTVHSSPSLWEDGAPEVRVIGERFGCHAEKLNIVPDFWVQFNQEIRANESLHRLRCRDVGVGFGITPPPWRAPSDDRSHGIHALSEIEIWLRDGME